LTDAVLDVPAPETPAPLVRSARLYGEPLLSLPADLYIPPEALEVILDSFEGPLDLLLYLIRRQNLDILDIPMAQVTRQYLAYIDQIRQGGTSRLERVADYLVMAATLIEIKSRMLLPPRPRHGDEEPEDPRAELVRRLIEYEQMKQAAADLDALPQHGREFQTPRTHLMQAQLPRLPQISAEDLRTAWAGVLARARLVKHHHIDAETLSVREHMGRVLRRLQGCRIAEFTELFELGRGVPVLVVTFIALLELAREQLIELTQAEAFAPIYVRLSFRPARIDDIVEGADNLTETHRLSSF